MNKSKENFDLNYIKIISNERQLYKEWDEKQKLNKIIQNNYRFDKNNEKNRFICTFGNCKHSVNSEQLMISHIKQHLNCEENSKTIDVFSDKSIDEKNTKKKISPNVITDNKGLGSLQNLEQYYDKRLIGEEFVYFCEECDYYSKSWDHIAEYIHLRHLGHQKVDKKKLSKNSSLKRSLFGRKADQLSVYYENTVERQLEVMSANDSSDEELNGINEEEFDLNKTSPKGLGSLKNLEQYYDKVLIGEEFIYFCEYCDQCEYISKRSDRIANHIRLRHLKIDQKNELSSQKSSLKRSFSDRKTKELFPNSENDTENQMDVMSANDSSDEELNAINEEEFGLNYNQINENESQIIEEFDENQKLNKMVKSNYRFDENNEKNQFICTFGNCKHSADSEELMIFHIKQHLSCEQNRKTSNVFNDKSIEEKKISPKVMTSNKGLGSLKYLGQYYTEELIGDELIYFCEYCDQCNYYSKRSNNIAKHIRLRHLGYKKIGKKLSSKKSNIKRGFFARKAQQLSDNNENNQNNNERQMDVMSANDSSVEELNDINAQEFQDFINSDSNNYIYVYVIPFAKSS